MSRALVVVPPLLKYVAGPLLGPAMLAGAARGAGHDAAVADLNIAYLRERMNLGRIRASRFAGDHDKPSAILGEIQRAFDERLRDLLPDPPDTENVVDHVGAAAFEHDAILAAARSIARSSDGVWIARCLGKYERPDLVGVSVLFGGQVYWALAASLVAKSLWPDVPVIWGGPHVAAVAESITNDAHLGEHVDGFVIGHAERTFVALLGSIERRSPWPQAVFCSGRPAERAGGDGAVVPRFERLEDYGIPRLNIPVQTSRGCAYGKCAFCTYPVVEGTYTESDVDSIEPMIVLAQAKEAILSLKDSLILPDRLREIARRVRGRARWSGCTKIHKALTPNVMADLAASGCVTLEIGLETVDPVMQAAIKKKQHVETFLSVVDAAASAGIALVVNYLTGFPHEDARLALELLHRTHEALANSGATYKVEHNTFQLERLSPMAARPEEHGLRVARRWPWSSLLDWREDDDRRSALRRSNGRTHLRVHRAAAIMGDRS